MPVARPIFRIFDYAKAIEFYQDWLGFTVQSQHTFGENFPVYLIITLDDLVLHLTEHHGDCSPGARILIEKFNDLEAYHKSLSEKNYKYNKPGLEKAFWNSELLCMEVTDPFGNRLTFVNG